MSKHTPGPWKIQLPTEEIFCTEIINGDWSADGKSWVASVHNQFVGIENGSANARLISAAPEMYEMLTEARLLLNSEDQSALGINELLNRIENV